MLFLFGLKKFKTKEKIDLQNVIHFYAFTQTNLNIWTTTSDCPSKVDYRNESLAVEVVEAVECPVSKLCVLFWKMFRILCTPKKAVAA